MNSVQRVMGTISGEAVDRTAVGAVLCMYGAKLTGCHLETYYNDPKRYFEGQIAVVEKFEPDFLLSPLCVAHEAKAFGCEIRYFVNNPPNITKRAVSSAKEIKDLQIPSWNVDPGLLYIRESIRLMAKAYHGQIPIGAVWMEPMDMLANALGLETFMELMIFNKSAFDDIMDQMIEFCVGFGNAMLSDGADMLINFGSLLNKASITRALAENVALPILQQTYPRMAGGILLHAGGYKIEPYIDLYAKVPNLLGFVVDSRDSLKNARLCAGDDKVILGNIEGPNLDIWTPDQINKICTRMLTEMAEDKHYILSTSSADIPYNTSEAQILALMKAPRIFAERR